MQEPTGHSRGARGARSPETPAESLVRQLNASFCEQVRRALDIDLDGSVTSLAFVDHYLAQARDEQREPILSLLAAGAGAYFGDLIGRQLGAVWIGDGRDPRRLRLLLRHQFLYFSPVDQAFEAILGGSVADTDPRLPLGAALDTSFHLRQTPQPDAESGSGDAASGPPHGQDDEAWIYEQLANLSPVSEELFYSLTGRFETLTLIVELLAARRNAEGCSPRTYTTEDYLRTLTSGVRASSQDPTPGSG